MRNNKSKEINSVENIAWQMWKEKWPGDSSQFLAGTCSLLAVSARLLAQLLNGKRQEGPSEVPPGMPAPDTEAMLKIGVSSKATVGPKCTGTLPCHV